MFYSLTYYKCIINLLQTECMEIDDVLTIDAENTDIEYTIVGVGKDKKYICNQCNVSVICVIIIILLLNFIIRCQCSMRTA